MIRRRPKKKKERDLIPGSIVYTKAQMRALEEEIARDPDRRARLTRSAQEGKPAIFTTDAGSAR